MFLTLSAYFYNPSFYLFGPFDGICSTLTLYFLNPALSFFNPDPYFLNPFSFCDSPLFHVETFFVKILLGILGQAFTMIIVLVLISTFVRRILGRELQTYFWKKNKGYPAFISSSKILSLTDSFVFWAQ